jgi:hypothetical protein
MHLCQLLLRLYHDKQAAIGAFIFGADPAVSQTLLPHGSNTNEMAYTWLPNEFVNKRVGVNLDDSKSMRF